MPTPIGRNLATAPTSTTPAAQPAPQADAATPAWTPATSTDEGYKKVTTKLGEREALEIGQRLWGGAVFGPRMPNNKQLGGDVSHGCVRHSNEDIVRLYDALSVGDHVAIVSGLKDARLRH